MDLRAQLCAISTLLDGAIRRAERVLSPEQLSLVIDWAGDLRVVRGCSPTTVAKYLDGARRFIAWAEGRELSLSGLTRAQAEDWLKSLFYHGRLSAGVRAQHLAALRSFFDWHARARGGVNPFVGIPSPKRERRLPVKFGTAELAALFGQIDKDSEIGARDYAFLLTLYATGARRTELGSLRLGQLQIGDRVGLIRFMGKGAKERAVKIHGEALYGLKEWLIVRDTLDPADDSLWLVTVKPRRGFPLSGKNLDRMLHRYADAAGLADAHLHRFRTSCATDLYDAGVDLELIRSHLGHEKLETTRRYLALTNRARDVRIPASRLAEVTGRRASVVPLWVRKRLAEGGDDGDGHA